MKRIVTLFFGLLLTLMFKAFASETITVAYRDGLYQLEIKPGANIQKSPKMSAEISKTIDIATPGTLSAALTANEKNTINKLIVTGLIDARDFKTIRDSLPLLTDIDLSGSNIAEYTGTLGTDYSTISISYPANTLPKSALFKSTYYSIVSSVILPATIHTIGSNAFNGTNINNIIIPPGVTTIENHVFSNCRALSMIHIPASVSFIGLGALTASGLTTISVDIQNKNFSSQDGVLFNSDKTELIQFPKSKTGSYIIPSKVTALGNLAFYGNGLTHVTIPSSLISIKNQSFNYSKCTFEVDAANPNYCSEDGVLYNKSKTIILQCSTERYGVFSIPLSVTTVGVGAFTNCSYLTSVVIPQSVTYISSLGFHHCVDLSSIILHSSVPPTIAYSSAFDYVNKNTCVLHVPVGSKSVYQSAATWMSFVNIMETVTDVKPLRESSINVTTEPGKLIVSNAEGYNRVYIYTLSGSIVREMVIGPKTTSIPLPAGVYVVRIGGFSGKVIIR